MSSRDRNQPLRRQLHLGDPLPPGETLNRVVSAQMRHRALVETRGAAPRCHWQVAMAAAALTSTLGGAYLLFSTTGPLTSGPEPPRRDPTAIQGAALLGSEHATHSNTAFATDPIEKPAGRQIQFTTRGGTRVIWLLKPSLDIKTQP